MAAYRVRFRPKSSRTKRRDLHDAIRIIGLMVRDGKGEKEWRQADI